MKKDLKDSCQTTMRRHSGSSRRTMRSSQEKCQGGISDSTREKEKENQEKKGSHQRGGFKPFRKSGSGGKANMANENYDPHVGEKAKERRERKENQNSNIPMMETKVIHPMRMAKERADMTKRRRPPSSRLHHP